LKELSPSLSRNRYDFDYDDVPWVYEYDLAELQGAKGVGLLARIADTRIAVTRERDDISNRRGRRVQLIAGDGKDGRVQLDQRQISAAADGSHLVRVEDVFGRGHIQV
jgi:hypothetical protein